MRILFNLFYDGDMASELARSLEAETGQLVMRQFPDGETYLRLESPVKDRPAVILADLHRPDAKLLPLIYLCRLLRDSGAARIDLVVPYLPYMRQDIAFHEGEAVTSRYFAELVSGLADRLITIDPHLHRYGDLDEIYTIPTITLHANQLIARWIRNKVERPVLVGPDRESEQWVAATAKRVGCPYMVLGKTRLADRQVKISTPKADQYLAHTPVLLDDIISTGHTMMETARNLQACGLKPPLCIGVHGLFSGDAYQEMRASYIGDIVTTNTIPHGSNRIDVRNLIVDSLKSETD